MNHGDGASAVSEAQREQLLMGWNETGADYPGCGLAELVELQAGRSPEAVAVVCGGERLTFEELDARANRLANFLVGLGVGPEVLVGICVQRSVQMVVGLLGILKAGGAYVPIDPAYPADRQAFMLRSSEAPVVLTEAGLRAGLPAGDARVVCLDADWPEIVKGSDLAPGVEFEPEQLAYVIYTSGSTGEPKGVQIPHRAIVNFLWTMRERPGLTAEDVLVAVTTLSFDIAGLELFLPLVVGARVVIATGDVVSDPRALADLLTSSGATVMQATPTTWRMLVDSGWSPPGDLKGLCGGEALPVVLADRLVRLGVELWNMYGPTETTVWSTCTRVQTPGERLTIGRPIANTSLFILNDLMAPVAVGEVGELWIGGDGLARGYRGRPDLTQERFVPSPFTPGARIYRTGDLARYRPDGEVEFLGRVDHQVKVNGFRIELGEIETVLARHPDVADAVVVARGEGAEAELAAYVVPKLTVAGHELRQYAAEKLPVYMVPSTVTLLAALPLTPNGKVDRQALPEPTRVRSADRELVAPRTSLERRLATIWQRELGIERIGVTDNFFDLGVRSIVAASLFAAIEHEIADGLPLGAIFRAPTIETLARLIEGEDASADAARWTSLVPIQPRGSLPPIFCVHGGAGSILYLHGLAASLGPEQPFYGLQARGLYGKQTPLTTVEAMAEHYLSEMRQVHAGGPWRVSGYCFGALVAFEIAQRLVARGEEVELLAAFNGPSPAWIKQWGWHGNQPSQRQKLVVSEPAPARRTKAQRIRRLVRHPGRLRSGFLWQTRRQRARLALVLGRPLAEELRESYFFGLHHVAEAAYEPRPYPGEMLVFYGQGLYEDPELGWSGLASGGLRSVAVPGEHTNNRHLMREPAVSFVAARLQEYLSPALRSGHGHLDDRLMRSDRT